MSLKIIIIIAEVVFLALGRFFDVNSYSNFLFHPLGSLPADSPGSERVEFLPMEILIDHLLQLPLLPQNLPQHRLRPGPRSHRRLGKRHPTPASALFRLVGEFPGVHQRADPHQGDVDASAGHTLAFQVEALADRLLGPNMIGSRAATSSQSVSVLAHSASQ